MRPTTLTNKTRFPLPPKNLRWGGPRFADDAFFIESGEANIRMLEAITGLKPEHKLLDMGCGSARLLLGMLHRYGQFGEYAGVDVHKPMIDWADANLAVLSPKISFHWQDVHNARYHPKGQSLTSQGALPFETHHFDRITLFSVFSHMWLKDIRFYLGELARVLKPDGRIFLTAFVDNGVADEVENPPDYHREWKGHLHCVRLNRATFEGLVHTANLRVEFFRFCHTADGQSSYALSRQDQPPFRAKVVLG